MCSFMGLINRSVNGPKNEQKLVVFLINFSAHDEILLDILIKKG